VSEEKITPVASHINCDPELFLLLISVFNGATSGRVPIGEVVIGNREKAKHIQVQDSPLSRGMIAMISELRARGIEGDLMHAYMTRTLAFIDVLKNPGERVSSFVTAGDLAVHCLANRSYGHVRLLISSFLKARAGGSIGEA